MLSVESDKAAGFVEIEVDGAINAGEYQTVISAIDEALKVHERLNLVGVLRGFGPVELSVWPRDLVFHVTHRNWMRHVAIVSDMAWVEPTMRIFAPFYAAKIQCFALARLDEARAWARTGNVSRAAD